MAIAAAVGEKSLGAVSRGSPVAAAFTRVGGSTRVETAIDASRFWSSPPACFVTIPANADPSTMISATHFAMVHNAPLLYFPRNLKRRQRVLATIDNWRAETGDPSLPVWITAKSFGNSKACGAENHNTGRLSTLAASNGLLPRPLRVKGRSTLADVVVFAVARGPGYPPDVVVGLALAAHMALEYPRVSLVVLPRYLEADGALENQLRDQQNVVQGGVVLGSAGILTEDTHALLRQILTSTDQQAVLSQKQTLLSQIGSDLASLLPVAGDAATAGAVLVLLALVVIPPIIKDSLPKEDTGEENAGPEPGSGGPVDILRPFRSRTGADSMTGTEWINILRDLDHRQKQYVTVWLRSGWQVAGQYEGSGDPKKSADSVDAKVIWFSHAKVFRPEDMEYLPLPSVNPQRAVYVSIDDIVFVGAGFQEKQ